MNTTLTTKQLAERWGISISKVLKFVDAGELTGLNMAISLKGKKPRYRFTLSDVEAFENRRRTQPKPAPTSRRRPKIEGVTEYF